MKFSKVFGEEKKAGGVRGAIRGWAKTKISPISEEGEGAKSPLITRKNGGEWNLHKARQ